MSTRKEILEMLAQGQIDVTRATEMLNEVGAVPAVPTAPDAAVEPGTPELVDYPAVPAAPEPVGHPAAPRAPKPVEAPAPPKRPAPRVGGLRWLHIHVSELNTGQDRVRVNVPLGLINFGLRLGARFTDELDSETVRDVLRAIQDDETIGTLVEVEDVDDNERVHIFVD